MSETLFGETEMGDAFEKKAMTHEEVAKLKFVEDWCPSKDPRIIQAMLQEFSDILASAEKKGRDDCLRDNVLLNDIRNEQFKLGWNSAIEEAVKVAEEFCNDSFKVVSAEWEKFHNERIADKIKALKKE